MRESGQVISVNNSSVIIKVVKSDHCKGCTACNMFDDGHAREIVLHNDFSAKIGDLVEIEISPKKVVGHSFLIFIFPLLFMISGYVVGAAFSIKLKMDAEPCGIFAAIVFLILSFFIIYIYDKISSQKDDSVRVVSIQR